MGGRGEGVRDGRERVRGAREGCEGGKEGGRKGGEGMREGREGVAHLEVVHDDGEQWEVDGCNPGSRLGAVVARVTVMGGEEVAETLDSLFTQLGVPGIESWE